jgi:hypothetical protein
MWLINKLAPDFRIISDYRKNNKEAIAKVFKEFNKFCIGLKLFSKSYISIDGSKFKAVTGKDRNFTLSCTITLEGWMSLSPYRWKSWTHPIRQKAVNSGRRI